MAMFDAALQSNAPVNEKSANEIEHWLTGYLLHKVGLDVSGFDVTQSFASLGLDSLEAELLLTELESWLERRLDSNRITRCRTVKALLDYLVHDTTESEITAGAGDAAPSRHPFETFVNPALGERIRLLRFDKRFVRGEGSILTDAHGRRYLDFLACYGAVPFGHNPPEIWAAISRVKETNEPTFVQPAALEAAGELARRLVAIAPAGLRHVTFANSGAEAIEAAIKCCRAATRRVGILTTSGGFHGKTMGALSATGNEDFHEGFGVPVEHFHGVPYGNADALRNFLDTMPGYFAAFIVEPIQGEGGIVVPKPGYLAEAKRICKERGVVFVVDEVQTGLGRTGEMFACFAENVLPDVMVLAKALGGGIVPIGACLMSDSVYTNRFGFKHSSTFAGNSLACRVAIATIDLLERDGRALLDRVAENGEFLRNGLLAIQARHPHIIAEVRGRGYMLGICFQNRLNNRFGSVLDIAAEQGILSALVSTYLLNVHGLRVAPTLNGAEVVRVEPPLTANRAECEEALAAIEKTIEVFALEDAGAIVRGILHGPDDAIKPVNHRQVSTPRQTPADASRLAFVLHPLDAAQYRDFDPSLASLSDDDCVELNSALGNVLAPFVADEAIVRTPSGAMAHCEFIVIPRTAEDLMAMPEAQALSEVQDAVMLGRSRGARLVGLGAYSSVVARGGHGVGDLGVAITTGNSYTVISGYEAITMALEKRDLAWENTTAAVLGAGGAVGRGMVIMMAERVARLCLVGNPRRSEQHTRTRLGHVAVDVCRHIVKQIAHGHQFPPDSLAGRLQSFAPPPMDAPIETFLPYIEKLEQAGALIMTRFHEGVLPFADVIVTATSSPEVLISAQDALAPGAIVCDLSRPSNIDPNLKTIRPDVVMIDGGLIEVPGGIDLSRFGLAPGHTYACMAEALLLGLERTTEHHSLGSDLPIEGILKLQTLANKYGFRVAPPQDSPQTPTNVVVVNNEVSLP